MTSLETERKLFLLLSDIAAGEEAVERARQRLSADRNFSLFSVYRRLDSAREGAVSALRLREFIRDLGVEITERDARDITRQYDSTGSQVLHLEEVAQLLVSSEDAHLRQQTLERPCGEITFSVLSSLRLLLTHEVSYHRSLHSSLRSLCVQRDFSLRSVFSVLVPRGSVQATRKSLEFFMRKHGASCSVNALLRRVDRDGDEEIALEEFEKLVEETMEGESDRTGNQGHAGQMTDIFTTFAESLLISTRKREEIRLQLHSCPDFDLNSAFFPFDVSQKGYTTVKEFQSALLSLGVNASERNVSLLFSNHCEKMSAGRLSFSQFCNLVEPKYREKREIGGKRPKSFSCVTKSLLGDLWITLLFDSQAAYDARFALNFHPEADFHGLFSLISSQSHLPITESDMEEFLRKSGIRATSSEVRAVITAISGESAEISYCELLNWRNRRQLS